MTEGNEDIRNILMRSDDVGDPEVSYAEDTGAPGGYGYGYRPNQVPHYFSALQGELDEMVRNKRPMSRRHVQDFARRAVAKDRQRVPYRGPAFGLHNRVMQHFVGRHGGADLTQQQGEYWSTVEVIFDVDGDTGLACASVDKATDFEAFTEHTGQANGVRMGQPYKVTTADTNLSHPSQLTYVDEVFMITGISARFGGLRIAYDAADYQNLGLSGHLQSMAAGRAEVWDKQGLILPKDLFDDFTGECLLLKILRTGSLVSFKWTDMGAGGNAQSKTVIVDTFDNIPITGMRSLESTSGGARSHTTKGGYLWTLNNDFPLSHDSGGNGLFSAALQVQNEIALPFTPIKIKGSAERIVPKKIGVYIELRLHGIGFWAGGSPRQTSRHGRPRSMETIGERFRW